MAGNLGNAVALVTGASRGIGRAVAERFAAEGACVVLNDHKPLAADVEQARESISRHGHGVEVIDTDVSDPEAVEAMVAEAVERFGRIDILVNNAGIARPNAIDAITVEDWDRTLGVNLKAQFLLARAVVPEMRDRRAGSIVNIASELGLVGDANHSAYCASKAGVIGFTKALAHELAPLGVRVNCIAPGPTDTAILRDSERTPEFVSTIPVRRLGTAAEIASAVWFLASPESSWTTGQVLSPNGGMVI